MQAMVEPLDDGVWVRRCVDRLVALDPALDPERARPVAEDMCTRPRWRAMAPEAAAQALFDVGTEPRRDAGVGGL
jgi:hypothetical protein